MDYYVIINEQKKGPLDIITLIKRVHAGVITAQTPTSTSFDGQFVPAIEHPHLKEIFAGQPEIAQQQKEYTKINVSLGKTLADGIDLWSRYAVSFTAISGIILALAFALSKALADAQPIGAAFVVSLITSFLYLNFFGYILLAKRSQAASAGKFMSQLKGSIGATFGLSILISLFTCTNAINPLIGMVAMLGFLIFGTLVALVPFLAFDKNVGLFSAIGKSMKGIIKGGAETFGVVLTLIALNIIVAVVPAIFVPQLFIFGLFISIPISASSLAFIYDEVSV